MSHLRRLIRRFLPRRTDPLMDASLSLTPLEESWAAEYERSVASRQGESDAFVFARFREGLRWRNVLDAFVDAFVPASGRRRVLDVGAGNGAIELALGASPRWSVVSVEALWNGDAAHLHRALRTPFRRACATATGLPFGDQTFDAILCLETLEHLSAPRTACAEMARTVRRGGVILLTTPPRWRYALARDPHFGIRSLVLFPPRLQRRIAARAGFEGPHHYVDRLYGSVPQIANLFPGCRVEHVLTRGRAPRRWFWDAIVLRRVD